MKKITAFFLAFLPLFIIVLLFITGMLIKNYTHVYVSAVEFTETSRSLEWGFKEGTHEPKEAPTWQTHVNVLPFNATNPEIEYFSTNENIITVDDNGLVKAIDFGEASIYAVSKENETLYAKCDFEVTDDEVHRIDVDDYSAEYVSLDQSIDLSAKPVPSKHVDGDLSLKYASANPEIVTVAPDGEITALSEGTTDITVTLKDPKYSWIVKTVPVRVGLGVSAMEFKNPTNEVISTREYSIFDELVTYPEKCSPESEFFGPTDFTYEVLSNNDESDIATVDENGKLTFKQPGKVTIRVTCRRNKNLVLEKDIESTFEGYTDVAFNRYNFKDAYADYQGKSIPWEVLNWQTFPNLDNPTDVTITSSNTNVVSVVESVTEPPKLNVVGAGSTMLTATAPSADGSTISDVCYVTFTKPIEESFIVSADVKVTGTYNYYLRDNIKTDVLSDPHQKITWEIVSGTDYASIDENEIIHFSSSNHIIWVRATIAGETPNTFSIRCQNASIPPTTIDITNGAKIVLQAGQRYAFRDNQGYYWAPPEEIQNPSFYDLSDDTYIARHGIHNTECVFWRYDTETTIKVDLIITEDALDISYDPDQTIYVESTTKPIDYAKVARVTPSTATDSDGNPIQLQTEFVPEKPEAVTIDQNFLTFNQASRVLAKSTYGEQEYQFLICNNYDQFGKFNLVDDNPEQPQPVYSGAEIYLTSERRFYLDGAEQPTEPQDKFTIVSKSGNDLINSEIGYDETTNRVYFAISPKEKAYGNDTILIKSGTFTFYLNVTLDDKISSFNVSFKDQKLDTTTLSYTNNLILNVWATPLSKVGEDAFTVTLNNEPIDVDWDRGTVDLREKLLTGTNTLVLKASSTLGGYSQTYTINFEETPSELDFSVLGSYQKGQDTIIPIECGDTQKTLVIVPAGGALVDSEVFSKFDITLTRTEQEIWDSTPNARGKAYIQGIPLPTNENKGAYETSLSIKYGDNPAKQFKLSREIVSKVEFPGHDNNSMEDQRGLQKVHVYGNKSYYDPQDYDPEEKRGPLLNYYKLPINLYDYKGELIEDDPTKQGDKTKENAFNTLKSYVNNSTLGNFKYKNVDETVDKINKTDFIAISFTEAALYDTKEINDNIFDGHEPSKLRNVNFGVSTWTGSTHADYTFVPVDGVNAYCQEALRDDNNIPISKVLQTNFGLGPQVQDNVPLTDTSIIDLTTIYGNGYTLNFSEHNKTGDDVGIHSQNIINTTISGCLDNERDHIAVHVAPDRNNKFLAANLYYRYSICKNLLFGLNIYGKRTAHIKNCLCYDNKLSSIASAGNGEEGATTYVEDSVMFNSSSTAMIQAQKAKIYFKGFIDVYNFKGKEILKNLPFDIGDLSYLWPVVESTANAAGALQRTAAGTTAVNSALISADSNLTYFWDGSNYIQAGKGLPTAFNYAIPYFDVPIEIMGIKPGLWATLAPNSSRPDAPSYYDQFDGEGNLRWDFLNNQLVKIMRSWSSLPYVVA